MGAGCGSRSPAPARCGRSVASLVALTVAVARAALPPLPDGQVWTVARLVQPADIEVPVPGSCTIGRDTRPGVGCAVNPMRREKLKTRAFAIGRGAIVAGAIGIDPLGRDLGGEPIRLSVVLRDGARSQALIDRVLDPATADGWIDYATTLAAGAPNARLAFVAIPVGPSALAHLVGPQANFGIFTSVRVHEPHADAPPANILLLSIDTLRADHLGVYGCDLPTSPNIDRFAAGAALLEHVESAYPSTTGSHMTMLTGVYPRVHLVWAPVHVLSPQIRTLPETLGAHGWSTAAVTEDAMVHGPSGFYRGFNWYREYKAAYPSEFVKQVVGDGLDWLAAHRGERFFLFLHTYVVHDPFKPPPEFDLFSRPGPLPPERADPDVDRRHYAGEVRYADHEVQRLLDGLHDLGLDDRTIVMITADHGHSFDWRHGFAGHGMTLAEEVMHVPLIVRAPGLVAPGTRLHETYSLADVTPTLLDFVGVPSPPVQGRSFAGKLRRGEADGAGRGIVYSDLNVRDVWQHAAYLGSRKWIVGQTIATGPQLYDLTDDPGEWKNLQATPMFIFGKSLVASHARECDGFLARWSRESQPAVRAQPNADTMKALKALGYVQ